MASTASTVESTPAPSASPAERILLFSLGARIFGCRVDVVREIIPSRRFTRLPGAPPYVRGLINLRGSILTVLDVALRLGEGQEARADGSTVLVQHGQRVVGLAVDDVMDVQALPTERLESAAGDAPGRASGIVRGLGHLGDGRVVILLDIPTMVGSALRKG